MRTYHIQRFKKEMLGFPAKMFHIAHDMGPLRASADTMDHFRNGLLMDRARALVGNGLP